jgi:predicted nucleic acid-binding protein
LTRRAARQRAQQNLPKSLRLYSEPPALARNTLETRPQPVASLVLDSNVVLDWFVFREPSIQPVAAAVTTGRVRWIATQAMRDELEHVLTRAHRPVRKASWDDVLAGWHRWAEPVEAPPTGWVVPLRCTDPDDQKFIDLALHAGAATLLSRDRAVLKLAGRARRLGLTIQTAASWTGA